MSKPKIFILDIENTPNKAYVWALFQETTSSDMIESPWHMLCWSGKFLGEKKIYSSSLIDFPKSYKKDPENDVEILKQLWKFMDEADIIVGHNVKGFDVRKANARFIMNGMNPPSPYKIVDTLQVARQHFMFTSNKLKDLSKYLGLGEKIETGGIKLWEDCMKGKKSAWKKMVKYCENDVVLTEKIYLKLLPYINNHPNLGTYVDTDKNTCPKCGKHHLQKEGFSYTTNGKYQRYSCKSCHAWCRGKENLRENKVKNVNP